MKLQFIIPYSGNKRQEMPIIYDSLSLEGIDTIVEPFCGTSAFSMYLSQKHPKKFKYILNDMDERIIDIYYTAKNETSYRALLEKIKEYHDYVYDNVEREIQKERYNSLKKNDDLASWIYIHRFYTFVPGLFCYKKIKFDIEEYMNLPFVKFLREENIEINQKDGLDIFKEYKDNKSALIFLDPPYLDSNNTFYKYRGLDIYPYLSEVGLKNIPAPVYLVVNPNEGIKTMFQEYFIKTYPKTYNRSKNKYCNEHVIISNRK